MDFQPQAFRDRSVDWHCVNCGAKMVTVEVKVMHRTGFSICEHCFEKLKKREVK